MTASEKLRALKLYADTDPPNYDSQLISLEWEDAAIRLLAALPLIADVVEAAEYDDYADDVDVPDDVPDDKPMTVALTRTADSWRRVKANRARLTALRNHLEGEA